MPQRDAAVNAQISSGPRYSIIPGYAPYDRRLTDFDIRILSCIGRHTDSQGWCFVSQTKLAAALGNSRKAVNRSISKLTKLAYLEKHDMRSAKLHGERRKNICGYRVLMDSPTIDPALVTPGSQGVEAAGLQGVDTVGLQHNDPLLNDPRNNDQKESTSPVVSSFTNNHEDRIMENHPEIVANATPHAHASRDLYEKDVAKELAGRLKNIDRNWLLGSKLLSKKHIEALAVLIGKYGAETVEDVYREILLEPGSGLRRQQINSWSFAESRMRR